MQEARFIALMLAREDALEAGEIQDVEAVMQRATDYALFLETDLTVEETAAGARAEAESEAQASYDRADTLAAAQELYAQADAHFDVADALEADALEADALEAEADDLLAAHGLMSPAEAPGTGDQPDISHGIYMHLRSAA